MVELQRVGSRLLFGTPRKPIGLRLGPYLRNRYVTVPEGKLLVVIPKQEAEAPAFTVIVNWPALLRSAGMGTRKKGAPRGSAL